jgi:hypothetical protein
MLQRNMALWVTSKNQPWAAEETGLSQRVIAKMYAAAREKNIVLTITRSTDGALDSTVGVPELFD